MNSPSNELKLNDETQRKSEITSRADGRAVTYPHNARYGNSLKVIPGLEHPEDDVMDKVHGSLKINCGGYRLYRTMKAQNYQSVASYGISSLISLTSVAEGHGNGDSAVGRSFVSVGSSDTTVKIWAPEENKLWTVKKSWVTNQEGIFCAVILVKGTIATGGRDGSIYFWDHKNWLWTMKGKLPEAHRGCVWSLLGLKNGKLLSGGSSNDPVLKLWNPKTRICELTISGHSDGVSALFELQLYGDVMRDGMVVSGGGGNDKTIRMWDLKSRTIDTSSSSSSAGTGGGEGGNVSDCSLKVFPGHTAAVTALAQLANGVLASSSGDAVIKLWNIDTGHCIRNLKGHTGWINCMCVLGDGVTLATGGSDKTIRLWDTTIRLGKKQRQVTSAFALEDDHNGSGAAAADGTESQSPTRINAHTAASKAPIIAAAADVKNVGAKKTSIENSTTRGAKNHNNEGVNSEAGGKGHEDKSSNDEEGRHAEDKEKEEEKKEEDEKEEEKELTTVCVKILQGHTNWVSCICVLGDGETIVSGGYDDTIRIWNSPK